jgi:hypothetical protein
MKKKDVAVKMTKKAFVKEHEHLLKVLKSGKGRKGEYQEQKEELERVR